MVKLICWLNYKKKYQCQFELTSQKGCDLAVRIDNKAYFVDGAHIDDFGDGSVDGIDEGIIVGTVTTNNYNSFFWLHNGKINII